MRLIALVIILVLIAFIVFALVRAMSQPKEPKRPQLPAEWEVNERSLGSEGVVVELVCAGQLAQPIGHVRLGDDFEYELEEARSLAQQRLVAMRARRRTLSS